MRSFLEFCFKGMAFFFINSNYRTFIWLMLRLGNRKRYKMIKMNVQQFQLHIPDGPSFLWQFYEIFFKEIYRFETNNKPPVILDCGANIGTASLYFKKLYPDAIIHAFEPDPKIFNVLKTNLEQNNISDVHLHEVAVWKEEGHLEFGIEGADSGSIFHKSDQTLKVKSIRLKEYISNLPHVDFLKIDIEGAELEVIKDCAEALGKVDHLFIEFHSYNDQAQTMNELLAVISNAGFRYYLENVMFRKKPFLHKRGKHEMDNQINIFAFRV